MKANLRSPMRFFLLSLALAFGSLGTARGQDLLEQFKRQQEIYAQKMEAEVNAALAQAQRLQATEPAKAADLLQKTLTRIQADTNLPQERKEGFVRNIRARLRLAENDAAKAAAKPAEPTRLSQGAKQQSAAQQQIQEHEQISKTLLQITVAQRDGRTAEANRLAQELLRQYPEHMTALGAGRITSANDVIANARGLRSEAASRMVGAMAAADRSALPANRDMEFPPDWKERVAKRTSLDGPGMTAKEKSIMKALATPVSVSYKDARFGDVVGELADKLNQPLLLDKQSLADAQVSSDTLVNLPPLRSVPARMVLRKILGDLGLAYLIKEETIQVVTQERAARETITKNYYIGDLLAGGQFANAGIRFNPWVDQFQAMQNVMSIMQAIQTIDPASWQGNGGFGTVSFHAPSMSLIIRQTSEIHNMIGGSFR